MPDETQDSRDSNGQSWLRRILPALLKRDRRGDVIAGNVGEGARGVAVGKNIVQIGTLVVPVLPAVGLLLLVGIVSAGVLWIKFVPGTMPPSPLNVAVAEFGQEDAQGRVHRSEDGRKLSEWMFTVLQSEYNSFPEDLRPVVWHDSMGLMKMRARIGIVAGDTEEERRQALHRLVDTLKADVVVYGNIRVEGGETSFRPEFYVAQVEDEADEIVGPHQLGSPVIVQPPIDLHDLETKKYLSTKLGLRALALAWFTHGLALDLIGDHKGALDIFKQAEVELDNWGTDGDSQGKEVLHYFIGREALYLSRADETWLQEAERAFTEALDLNQQYARAHIGLGGVYYRRAQNLPPDQRLNTTDLDQAIAEYTRAVEEGPDSPGIQTELKGRLGLGTAYRLRGEAYLHRGEYDKAMADYNQAIEYIETALPLVDQEQHRLRAEAYLALGATYQQKAHVLYAREDRNGSRPFYESARDAYSTCIALANESPYDDFLKYLKDSRCGPYRDDVQQVLDSLAGG